MNSTIALELQAHSPSNTVLAGCAGPSCAGGAEAIVYLHGAHVAHYRPPGGKPLLFMSDKSAFDPAKPIRGGVPLAFPWFGPRPSDPSAPLHGFARIMPWNVQSAAQGPDGSLSLRLTLTDTQQTRQVWPFEFALSYTVTIGDDLEMALEVSNPASQEMSFQEAMHTYLAVSDVRRVAVDGLSGATFVDKTDGMKRKEQSPEPLRITGETDRLYLHTQAACAIDDPAGARRITIDKSGSNSTVVWNPWIGKAKAMPDFGDDEWPLMICVETANAAEDAVTLAAGGKHRMMARIRA